VQVVGLVVVVGCQHEAHGAGIEVDFRSPDRRRNVQALPGPVEVDDRALRPIVQLHVETPRQADQELVLLAVRVRTATGARRHVIEIEHALDRKRRVALAFDERQVAQ